MQPPAVNMPPPPAERGPQYKSSHQMLKENKLKEDLHAVGPVLVSSLAPHPGPPQGNGPSEAWRGDAAADMMQERLLRDAAAGTRLGDARADANVLESIGVTQQDNRATLAQSPGLRTQHSKHAHGDVLQSLSMHVSDGGGEPGGVPHAGRAGEDELRADAETCST
jgi:hypothetical protein